MAKTLGQQLLARLRGRTKPTATPADDLPATPTVGELEQTMAAARSGRAEDCARLSLLLLACDADPGAGDVVRAAETMLADADPALWRNLDLATRRSWWNAPVWAQSAKERVASGLAGLLSLVVACFHPSGFVREAATARLGEHQGPVAVQALALRAGDWVLQVRDRARAGLERHLSTADGLLALGPLAVMLAGRVHGRWLAERAEAAMGALDDGDLARLRAAPDWRVRRAAYRVALAAQRLDLAELVQAAERDGDLVVRIGCAQAAIRTAAAAEDLDRVRPLLTSGTAAVRREAVIAFGRAGDTAAAVAALPDRNPLVREVAQAAIRRAGHDPAQLYRELITAADPPDPGALAGLGETGTPADVELVRASLTHPQPRGRVEAVRALRRLDAVDIETMPTMLQDPSGAVTRQVALSLRPHASRVSVDALTPLLAQEAPPHMRSAAYRVLREHDVWTRLLTNLELYDDQDIDMRNRARGDLSGWLNREAATTYSMPPAATADRLDAQLVRLADTLGPDRERLLRFHLGLTASRGLA